MRLSDLATGKFSGKKRQPGYLSKYQRHVSVTNMFSSETSWARSLLYTFLLVTQSLIRKSQYFCLQYSTTFLPQSSKFFHTVLETTWTESSEKNNNLCTNLLVKFLFSNKIWQKFDSKIVCFHLLLENMNPSCQMGSMVARGKLSRD